MEGGYPNVNKARSGLSSLFCKCTLFNQSVHFSLEHALTFSAQMELDSMQ